MATKRLFEPCVSAPASTPAHRGRLLRVPLHVWADALQILLLLGTLVAYLRGSGRHLTALLLMVLPGVLRFALAPSFRRRLAGGVVEFRRTLELYPHSGCATPWRAVFLFLMLPSAFGFLCNNYVVDAGDTTPVVLTAASLVTEGNCDLDEFAVVGAPGSYAARQGNLPYYLRRVGEHIYSNYPSGMLQFVLPVAAAARLAGADLGSRRVQARVEKWTSAWIAAASLAAFFLIALHLVRPAPAIAATFLFGVASPIFSVIGQALWQHGGVVLWSLIALFIECRSVYRLTYTGLITQGIACSMVIACRLASAVWLIPFIVWVLLRSPRRAVMITACAVIAYVPWAVFYGSIYGRIFGPSTGLLDGCYWSPDWVGGLAGLLVSPARGILVYQPWVLLAAAWCIPPLRHRMTWGEHALMPAGWLWHSVAVILLQLALLSGWRMWWGGHSWGSRLAAEIMPFCALMALQPVALCWQTAAGRRLVVALALFGFALQAPAVYGGAERWNSSPNVDRYPERLWSWSDAPFLYPLRHEHRSPESRGEIPSTKHKVRNNSKAQMIPCASALCDTGVNRLRDWSAGWSARMLRSRPPVARGSRRAVSGPSPCRPMRR